MAKSRTYKIKLIPATKPDGMLSFAIFDARSKSYSVDAATFEALDSAVRKLVQDDFKMDCASMITVPAGERKPQGFDKWRYANNFIAYNVPVEEIE